MIEEYLPSSRFQKSDEDSFRTFKSGCSKVCLNKMIKLTSLDPCLEVHLQLLMMQIYFLCEQPLHPQQ
jgi:hypothetical protein